MFSIKCMCLAIIAVMASAWPAWSQGAGATVNEGLETAFLYVDVVNGNDSNPGTASQPLKTIGAASGIAQFNSNQGIGTRVIINPGLYREVVSITGYPSSASAPVTFEAAINGTVVVSGAQQYTGWKVYSGNNNIYTNSWPYAWGVCPPGPQAPPAPDIAMRREMVYYDGWPLTQVLSLSTMTVDTFYVDEAGGTIYIWPPNGANVYTGDIEVAVQPTVWSVTGSNYLVVRGLTFAYANSCRENGAVLVNGPVTPSSNIVFDSDDYFWNNAQGLNMEPSVSFFTVENNVANHNGEAGFQAAMVTDGVWQSNNASFNNWRGAQGIYYNFNSSGAHFYQLHRMTVNDLSLFYNLTYGTHLDTDNVNFNIDNMVASENLNFAAFIERNEGPISITNSSMCNGNPTSSTVSNAGLDIRTSENVTATGNNIVGTSNGLWVMGVADGYQVTNWETGQLYQVYAMNVTFNNNVIVGGSGQQLFSDPNLNGTNWTLFQTTFSSDYNTWWNPSNSKAFTVPVPKVNTKEDYPTFLTSTLQDLHSVFQAPTGNPAAACWEAPDMVDYWFVAPYTSTVLTVKAGQSASWPATVVPLRFQGTVQLSYDGVQSIPGATANWSTTSLGPNQTATFTVTTSSTTPPGTYPVTMIGTTGGISTRTMTALLTVQ